MVLRDVLATTWPSRFEASTVEVGVPLGAEGLGLDSVELAEYVVACEERLGARLPMSLLEDDSLTIGDVAAALVPAPL